MCVCGCVGECLAQRGAGFWPVLVLVLVISAVGVRVRGVRGVHGEGVDAGAVEGLQRVGGGC